MPIRLLANRTAILVIIASVSVGIGMFGGTTFLGQYFQLARGYSPTHAGLLTIPLMAAMLLSSTLCGQIVSRTGRWKRFLVGGALALTAGLAVLGSIDHTSPIWFISIGMALMGLGVGAMMQNLVLAVQNTVDVSDIGATSASVAFFRSLGGALGVSVLGAVLADHVQTLIVDGLAALGITGSGSAPASLDLSNLPAPDRAGGPRRVRRRHRADLPDRCGCCVGLADRGAVHQRGPAADHDQPQDGAGPARGRARHGCDAGRGQGPGGGRRSTAPAAGGAGGRLLALTLSRHERGRPG